MLVKQSLKAKQDDRKCKTNSLKFKLPLSVSLLISARLVALPAHDLDTWS